jgi:hypothetical protein
MKNNSEIKHGGVAAKTGGVHMRQTQKETLLKSSLRQANPMERREAFAFSTAANAEFASEPERATHGETCTGKRLTPGGRG